MRERFMEKENGFLTRQGKAEAEADEKVTEWIYADEDNT